MNRDSEHRDNGRDFDRSAKKAQKSIDKKHKNSRRSDDRKRLDKFVSDYSTGRKDYDDNNDEEFNG